MKCPTCTAHLLADQLLDALAPDPDFVPLWVPELRYEINRCSLLELPTIRFTFGSLFPRDVQ